MIFDDVQGDLTTAHGSFDEAHDRELGLVEQEAVSVRWRDAAEGDERIRCDFRFVARQLRHLVGWTQEQFLVTCHACLTEGIRHVGLDDDGGANALQTIVDALDTGVIVGAAGGNFVDGYAGCRSGTHQAKKFPLLHVVEVNVPQK